MKSYKKILLTAAASLIIGTQAFAAEKLRIGTEGAYPPFNLIDASVGWSALTWISPTRCAPR